MIDIPGWVPIQQGAMLVAFLLAGIAVYAVDRPGGRWGAALRRRFLFGIPWGTVVTVAFVVAVYLFVQDGLRHWYSPVTLPFRAWSYFYPLGIVTAPFSHNGAGHLLGNLAATLTLAPLAEYAWGHYPRERGSASMSSRRTNPYVRAFVVFPAAVLVVGLATSVFALGPIIGFSGVVFAFAGFALVNYPLKTVVALAAGRALRLVYNAMQEPTVTASGHPTYVTPWWADIAIQGHALGLFIGVILGLYVVRMRPSVERPSALKLWTGSVLFAVSQSMWAIYWYRGGETYVLYRAVGVALVAVLALLVVFAAVASDRPALTGVFGGQFSFRRWQAGAACLVVVAAAVSGPAVPYNLYTTDGGELPGEPVRVEDYEVTYAEGVQNGMVSAYQVDAFGETTNVKTSGVIVKSESRGIWTTAASKGRLAFAGKVPITLGGLGWRETVYAERDGWNAVDGGTAYRVHLRDDGESRVVYVSDAATAGPVVGGRNISVVPTADGYYVEVERRDETVSAPLPNEGESVTVNQITFTREKNRVYAEFGGTRVRVLKKERYRGS
ncbi:rhomboid family intramembrane serine protease [Halopelagius longus]|uniref:Membrane associated serine protease, rhomboid family n=1 Tax=Halopelagius longus TaxID=1236180 RepID=A0A1H1AS97_9EURY|nr:rhomboid family intramembrane serine protease [Halopelagius longus]RDI70497.1 rhomboid family intramembrane serine protease [Halopelagius longus]SDQ42529.1 Membrane associated serine protease, rhomboid family [Halopelagius longus]